MDSGAAYRGRGVSLFAAVRELDLEGIVAEAGREPYCLNGSRALWPKIRNTTYREP